MGGCVSTSSHSTCSSQSNGESVSSSCMGIGFVCRKRTKRTFSDHVYALQNLPSAPNRIFMNGKSRSSCIFTQQGRKGINQDAMVVWEDFMSEDTIFCGVFDGHGPYGHLVARKVRDTLPIKLLSFFQSPQLKQNDSGKTCFQRNLKTPPDCEDSEKDGFVEDSQNSVWKDAFLNSYKAMDKELRSHPNLDCFCSGSTAVTIVKQGSNLFMGYIGDSRAILASKDANDSTVAVQLTVDLKPDLPREAFDDAPGLAMARAFGDFCLKEYGVISIPEFSHRTLTDADQFIVLASDGVSFLFCFIMFFNSKMDDCAVVCLFLDRRMDSESDCDEQAFSSATLRSNHSGTAIESDDGQRSEPCLQRNNTVRSSEENKGLPVDDGEIGDAVPAEDQNWLGLEGVTRVNSLVQLPRFSEERPVS